MQENLAQTPYEVACPDCRVTFPIGTRQCVHCGGPIARQRSLQPRLRPSGEESVVVNDELGRRPGGFSPMTLVWVVLLLGGYLYRSCST